MKYVILKALGKKDLSHLIKKVITDKRGKRTTVWVLPPGAKDREKYRVSEAVEPISTSEQFNKLARRRRNFYKEAAKANMQRWKKEKEQRNKLRAELVATGVNWRFRQELLKKGKLDLIGQRVEKPEDLAQMAQIYRNPLYETFRIFFLDKNNIIKGMTGITCRMPGWSEAFPKGGGSPTLKKQGFEDYKAKMERIHAVKYYLVHNHPSGTPKPSKEDKLITRDFKNGFEDENGNKVEGLPGFVDHIVLDHKTFGEATGKTDEERTTVVKHGHGTIETQEPDVHPLPKPPKGEDPLRIPSKPSGAIGKRINGPDDIASLVKDFQLNREGYFCLIGMTSQGQTTGIMEVPHDYMLPSQEKKGLAQIVTFARMCGAGYVVAANTKPSMIGQFVRAMQEGYLRDAIEETGRSYNISGITPKEETVAPPRVKIESWEEGEK